jgi:hypothetical protein
MRDPMQAADNHRERRVSDRVGCHRILNPGPLTADRLLAYTIISAAEDGTPRRLGAENGRFREAAVRLPGQLSWSAAESPVRVLLEPCQCRSQGQHDMSRWRTPE